MIQVSGVFGGSGGTINQSSGTVSATNGALSVSGLDFRPRAIGFYCSYRTGYVFFDDTGNIVIQKTSNATSVTGSASADGFAINISGLSGTISFDWAANG